MKDYELTQEMEEEDAAEPEDLGNKRSKSIRERALEAMESRYEADIARLTGETQQKKDELERQSQGRAREIALLAEKDRAHADMKAHLAKKDLELSYAKMQVETLARNRKFATNKKEECEKKREELIKRKGKAQADIEKYILEIPILTSAVQEMGTGKGSEKQRKKAEEKLEKANNDLQKKNIEFATLDQRINELTSQLDAVSQEIQSYNEEYERFKAEGERLEIEQKANKAAFSHMEKTDKKAEPKWYQGYLKAKSEYDKKAGALAGAANEKAQVQESIGNMEYAQLPNRKGGETEREMDAAGEGMTKKQLDAVVEEAKVEGRLRSLPILQEVNEDTINKVFLNYNPETGGQYEEGEEKKSSNEMINRFSELMDDKVTIGGKVVNGVVGSGVMGINITAGAIKTTFSSVIKSIDASLAPVLEIENPIENLLTAMQNADSNALKDYIVRFVGKISSLEFRKDHPILHTIAEAIFGAIIDLLKPTDNNDPISAVEGAFSKIGLLVGGGSSLIDTLQGDHTFKLGTGGGIIKETVANGFDIGKNAVSMVGNSIRSYRQGKDRKLMAAHGYEQWGRILSGAKRASVSNAVKNAVDIAASAGKIAIDWTIGLQKNPGAGAAKTAVSLAAFGLKILIGKFAAYRDKKSVLNSPAVLGSLKYDKKLVNEAKFNTILKRVSGITSKDKLYGAIKTVDSIALHSAMRKSYQKPDIVVDRVMGDLGYSRAIYPKLSVYDIMSKSGFTPVGSDWRQQLKDSMLVEGKDYLTAWGAIKEDIKSGVKGMNEAARMFDANTKSGADQTWQGIKQFGSEVKAATKSGISWIKQKIGNFSRRKTGRNREVALA